MKISYKFQVHAYMSSKWIYLSMMGVKQKLFSFNQPLTESHLYKKVMNISRSRFLLVCFCFISGIFCDNVTDKYVIMDRNLASRQHRLLTFNTQNNGDISVELAFNVPFISIPVKKSFDMAQGAIANVNLGAVILAGSMVFGIAVLIPGIFLFFSKKLLASNSNTSFRNDETESFFWRPLDEVLMANNIDAGVCLQRVLCWTIKKSAKSVSNQQGSSSDKIIDGLASSEWLQQAVYHTVVYSAVKNGLKGANCSKEYSQCKITQKNLQMLMKKFVRVVNG